MTYGCHGNRKQEWGEGCELGEVLRRPLVSQPFNTIEWDSLNTIYTLRNGSGVLIETEVSFLTVSLPVRCLCVQAGLTRRPGHLQS